MTVATLANLSTHSSTPQQLTSTSTPARWVCVNANSGATIGDSSITTSGEGQGIQIQANVPFFFPEACDRYDLSTIYVILQSGILEVMYGY